MLRTEKHIIAFLILLLLILNAVVRFYDFTGFSLSNDELSVVCRLNYSSFSELIQKGVIATDPHPAGVQVFMYYWTGIFGLSVFAIRLPFILSGLITIIFLYKTMSIWFSAQRALLITAFFSLTEFSLIQGQLARPYAMAMMFVMVFLWSWTNILYSEKKNRAHLISFIVSAVLASFSHYFAALMVGIIGLAGILPSIKKNIFKLYFLLGLVIVFLFATHLNITISQFSKPSLTSWIHKAEFSFILDHIALLLNNNLILMILASLCMAVSIFMLFRGNNGAKNFMLCSLLFFLTPITIAFIYSVFLEPILMNRVLYFSSPFFYAFILALIPDTRPSLFILRFSVLSSGVLFITLFQTNFLERDYVENFLGMKHDYIRIQDQYGNESITLLGNFNSIKYMNYYLKNDELKWQVTSISDNKELAKMMEVTRNSKDNLMAYFWACKYQPPAVLEYIHSYFPKVEMNNRYYNSGSWLFSKKSANRESLLTISPVDTSISSEIEFLTIYKDETKALINAKVVNIRTDFNAKNVENTLLVFSLVDKYDEVIKWEGVKLNDFKLSSGENELFYSFNIPEEYKTDDALSIYFWNPGKNQVILKNIEMRAFKSTIGRLDPQASTRRP